MGEETRISKLSEMKAKKWRKLLDKEGRDRRPSRWQRSKTWRSPSSPNTSEIHLHVEQLKYIRNTPTCGTTPTEHLLNAGRRPQTSPKARNSPGTWVGQKKKEKTDKRIRTGPAPVGGSSEGGKVSTLGSPFMGRDCGWWRGEASEPQSRVQQQGCRGQSGEIPAQRIGTDQHSPA